MESSMVYTPQVYNKGTQLNIVKIQNFKSLIIFLLHGVWFHTALSPKFGKITMITMELFFENTLLWENCGS
jgi:hypothetical protein